MTWIEMDCGLILQHCVELIAENAALKVNIGDSCLFLLTKHRSPNRLRRVSVNKLTPSSLHP